MRPNIHHRNPPIRIMARPAIRLGLNPRGDSVLPTIGVPVDVGVTDGLGEGVNGVGVRVAVSKVVAVVGGVKRRRSFCPGRMTDAASSPFQVIRFDSETSYSPAIQKSVSPLWTV